MDTVKWWRYVLAVIVMAICPMIFGAIAAIVEGIFNMLTPRAYRSTEVMINLIASGIGTLLAIQVADSIMKEKRPFFMMISCVAFAGIYGVMALYSIPYGLVQIVTEFARPVAFVVGAVLHYDDVKKQNNQTSV